MGAAQSAKALQSDRQSVIKAREEVIEVGNGLVNVINIDRLFQSDICDRLAYIYTNKLKGFRNETLIGIETSIGLSIPETTSQIPEKENHCRKIVHFFMDKVDILGQVFAEIKYCERIEEEIFSGISMREICSKSSSSANNTSNLQCCFDGSWKSASDQCQFGFSNQGEAKSALQELRSFNKNIVKSFKNMKNTTQRIVDAETVKELEVARKKLNKVVAQSRNICLGKWQSMNKYQDSNSIWRPEDFKRSRRYDRIIRDITTSNGFDIKNGTVVEILKVGKNDVLVRVPGLCKDEAKCLTAIPLDSLSKAEDFETHEKETSLPKTANVTSDEKLQQLKNVLSSLDLEDEDDIGSDEEGFDL